MIADKVRVELLWKGTNNTEMANVLHYEQAGDNALDFDMAGLASFAADVDNLVTSYLGMVSTPVHYVGTRCTVLSGNSAGLQFTETTHTTNPGSSAGVTGPIERCIIIRLRSLFIGRANRGRIYTIQPCVAAFSQEGTFAPGFADGTSLADFQAGLLVLRQGPATTCMQLTVLHHGTFVGSPVAATDVSTIMGIQRRRREA